MGTNRRYAHHYDKLMERRLSEILIRPKPVSLSDAELDVEHGVCASTSLTAGLHRERWQCNDGAGAGRRDATHTRAREAGTNALLTILSPSASRGENCSCSGPGLGCRGYLARCEASVYLLY